MLLYHSNIQYLERKYNSAFIIHITIQKEELILEKAKEMINNKIYYNNPTICHLYDDISSFDTTSRLTIPCLSCLSNLFSQSRQEKTSRPGRKDEPHRKEIRMNMSHTFDRTLSIFSSFILLPN